MKYLCRTGAVIFLFFFFNSCYAQRQMEYLNRGVYAANEGNGKIFVSWRLLGNEPSHIYMMQHEFLLY